MNKCFVCNNESSENILELGLSPIANNLESDIIKSQNAKKYPLNLSVCRSNCNHVQISEIIDQKEIFNDYFYMPSVSKTLRSHFNNAAKKYVKLFGLDKNSLIIDVGSNDGVGLLPFKIKGFNNLIGIEPAYNLSKITNKKGIKTINTFLNKSTITKIKKKSDEK